MADGEFSASDHNVELPSEPEMVGNEDSDAFVFPLLPQQLRFWRADRALPGNRAYNVAFRHELTGPINPRLIERAFQELTLRHEALRGACCEIDGAPMFVVADSITLRIVERDLCALPDAQREIDMERLCVEDAQHNFDLVNGPLIRVGLIRMADQRFVLTLTLHHMVCDGWSVGQIMDDFPELYCAAAEGTPSSLKDLEIQFGDYLVWFQERRQDPQFVQQIGYWKRNLAGYRPLKVSGDLSPPRGPCLDGDIVACAIPDELISRLKAFSDRQGGTLFITAFAALMTFLHIETGKDDLCVGSPIAGRTRPEIEKLVGPLLNYVLLRVSVADDMTFNNVEAAVREAVLDAFANQEAPLELIADELRKDGENLPDSPFNICFVSHRAFAGGSNFTSDRAGVHIRTLPSKSQGALYDLFFFLIERENGWRLSLEYRSELYSRENAQRLLDGFCSILSMAPDCADRPISVLGSRNGEQNDIVRSVLDRAVQQEDASTEDSCPSAKTGSESLRNPSTPEAAGFEQSVEIAKLDDNSPQGELEEGEDVGDFALPASFAQERFWLLSKAPIYGQAFNVPSCIRIEGPLDVSALAKSLDFVVERHEALRTIFEEQDDQLLQVISPSSGTVLSGDRIETVDSNDPAYLLARAREKAIEPFDLSRGPLIRAHLFQYNEQDNFLVLTLHHAICDGHSIGLLQRDLWRAYEALRENRAPDMEPLSLQYPDYSVWQREWVDSPDAVARLDYWRSALKPPLPIANFPLDRMPSGKPGRPAMDYLSLSPALLQKLAELGRTENLTRFMLASAAFAIVLARFANQEDVLFGCPSANRNAETEEIIGPFSSPLALRFDLSEDPTLAEIVERARGVTLETLVQPDIPFELLVENLNVRSIRGRTPLFQFYFTYQTAFVRSRDLCGLRVSPVSDLVVGTPYEIQLSVIERPDEVVAKLEYDLNLLDASTVQHILVYYEKVLEDIAWRRDKRLSELSAPSVSATPQIVTHEEAPAYEAPKGSLEESLAQIWGEVLGVDRVGRRDNFFDLGGHSLLAARVMSRVRKTLGLEATLADLFAQPTLAGLADAFQHASSVTSAPILPADRSKPLELSFAQQRLWFLAQLEGASQAYHLTLNLRLKGELDRNALRRALDGVVARHEALRTTFREIDGAPAQIIAPADTGMALAETDLRGRHVSESEVRRLMEQEAATGFDLVCGPLIRASLIQLADDEHLLLITMHHIVSDGWSMGVLVDELASLYGAFRAGKADPLPTLPVQYADFAAWERNWLQGGDAAQRQSDYWKSALGGAPALLELPSDRPRPARQDYSGALADVALDADLSRGLRELSGRNGVTLYMTLLAAWAALMTRLSGQEDVVIGSPTANRNRTEIEPLIGFFVNTLALRLDLSGSPTIGELLARVRAQVLAAQQNQDIPFEKVVEAAQPARSLAHSPLFQVMFAWQNAPRAELELPGLQVASLSVPRVAAQCDLVLSLKDADGVISGRLEYATSLFERPTIERYLAYWRTLLEAMVADEAQNIDQVTLLSDAERHKLLVEWNATAAEYPKDKCVHQLFEEQAAKNPDAIAVVHENTQLTYSQINQRANQLAHRLSEIGVRPDTRVAICAGKSIEMVQGVLAVWKAGGAYVPLDPAYPVDRLRYMLNDCGPVALLTDREGQTKMGGGDASVPSLNLEKDAKQWEGLPSANPVTSDIGLTPENLAYVIYTSGSTGAPKGVTVEHRGLCNLALAQIKAFAVEPTSRVLQFASFSFDACASEFVMTLCRGATLCLPPRETIMAGATLVETVARYGVTHVTLPPSALATLPQVSGSDLDTLTSLIVAGEAPTSELARRWADDRRFINAYGPTETTVCATTYVCAANEQRNPPIGRPISNVRIYVLDALGRPAPIGVTGEIYIGGAQVARGYLNRPDLTAERFLKDPFSDEPNARMYRTGDQGRWLPDGVIEYLGRNDFQVKIRGFRIELGEIEARLAAHPKIRDAVVLAREDSIGDTRLVAYFTGEKDVGAEELRLHAAAALPDYMTPAAYMHLERLPLTPNGKVDRKALPQPGVEAYKARDYEPPISNLEESVAQLWADALGVSRVGRHDNFFELGGHSLLAARLFARIEQEFGRRFHLSLLFKAPTLEHFVKQMQEEQANEARSPNIVILQSEGDGPPLFAINTPSIYYALSKHLGRDRPFVGLQLIDAPADESFSGRELSEIAAEYVRLVRQVQPNGPYSIMGWCVGGILAFETARQLAEAGEEISFVGVISGWAPGYPGKLGVAMARLTKNLARLRRLRDRWADRGAGWSGVMRFLSELRPSERLSQMVVQNQNIARGEALDLENSEEIVRRLAEIARRYDLKPLAARVTVFRPSSELSGPFLDRAMGWKKFAKRGVKVASIAGDHSSIFKEPGAGQMAAHISQALSGP